jgi:bile acid:Na+ symporter, BASS family
MDLQKIAAIVMLVSLMLSAGLEINREHLMSALRDFGLLVGALIANFIIVPILGVVLVRLFHLEGDVAIGFLLMAIAAGVPFLVRAAGRQPGGNLGFAAALAFILPALSIVTIPVTAHFVLPPDAVAHVPVVKLVITLVVFQLVPLLIGLLITDRAPAFAAKAQRPLLLLFFVAVLTLLVILGPALVKAVASVYGSNGMLAMLVIVLLSVAAGWLLGGPAVENRRTLGIATALRNIGTCAVIATASFPDTLVGPTVLTYFLIQFIVTVLFRIYFHRSAAAATEASKT